MKLRTKIDLKDELDKDLAWRKRELTAIIGNVNTSESKSLQLALRTAILLLYAHWEGFIKKAAEAYLNYVKHQSLKLQDLNDSFLAIALKQRISLFSDSNKSTLHCEFTNYIRNNLTDDANINHENVISAKSNLNSEILKQILTSIGINYGPYELKANLLDEQLLNYRNTIAHGEYLKLDKSEYQSIHKEIFNMINDIKTSIENAVALDEFKKQ